MMLVSVCLVGYEKALAVASVLDHRSITMSSSAASANNTQYIVAFNYGTVAQTVGGIVIDFCSEDPISGDSCSIPTGFNDNINTGSAYGAALLTAQSGTTGWSIDTANSSNKTIVLTRTAGASSSPQSLTFGNSTSSGILNPSTTNASFYARIFTFPTAAGAQGYTSSNPNNAGTFTDFGGIALSTANQLNITAKIEEQLTLCLYTGVNCGAGGTSIVLGDTNGILNTSHSYSNINAKMDASTNAGNGMVIFGQGVTLTSAQNFTIAAIGSSAQASSIGTEQFGFCVVATGGSITAAAPYNDGSCGSVTNGADNTGAAKFAFDVSSSPNMTSIGGMQVASSSGPSLNTQLKLAYVANIAPTTRSGVYTTTQTFIGVGTF